MVAKVNRPIRASDIRVFTTNLDEGLCNSRSTAVLSGSRPGKTCESPAIIASLTTQIQLGPAGDRPNWVNFLNELAEIPQAADSAYRQHSE